MLTIKMFKEVWCKLQCPSAQLQLSATLTGGQSFRWKKFELTDGESVDQWIGVMGNCLWLLKQSETHLFYTILGELPYPQSTQDNTVRMKVSAPAEKSHHSSATNVELLYTEDYYVNILKSYFRLDVNLKGYYEQWCLAHKHFKSEADHFYAVRVLDQDPVENLFSFICSQNNHISRISSLVESLCTNYGTKICTWMDKDYYAFPNVDSLAKTEVEAALRKASFGYRAKFIQKSAEEILAKGNLEWFTYLKSLNYKDAHKELTTLTGIGPKVADCICLMSLNHLQAIPVDTHIYQITSKYYLPHLSTRNKTVTSKMYTEIGDHFREVYGPLAGWAQTILFCSNLKKFKENTTSLAGNDEQIPSKRKKQ